MADEIGYTISEHDVNRLRAALQYFEQISQPANRRRQVLYPTGGGGGPDICGRVLTAITPATNGLDGATAFDIVQWIVDDDTVTPKKLKEEVDDNGEPIPTPCVNRSTQLSRSAGGFCICAKVKGDYLPIWVEQVCSD